MTITELRQSRQSRLYHRSGTVLLMVLWTLALLTAFSVNIGLRIRNKMTFVQRIENRHKLRTIALAGIHKARSVVYANLKSPDPNSILLRKMNQFNNPQDFQNVNMAGGSFDVTYTNYDRGASIPEKRYGLIDEQGKININHADQEILKNLMLNVITTDEDAAQDLANAIYDWRVFGESEIVGFFSDEYYDNLQDPYEEKKAYYEQPHELLVVRGITDDIYNRLKDFLTIYGSGSVNFNTASWPVLKALGMEDPLVAKILSTRRGPDDIEATVDDIIFANAGDVITTINQYYGLSQEENDLLKNLSSRGLIGTYSQIYGINSVARIYQSKETKSITCVFNINNGKIIYWREW